MQFRSFLMLLATLAVAAFVFTPETARAQNLADELRKQGYTDIKVIKRTFSKINLEACQNGVRYLLKLRATGRLRSKTKIGDCGRVLSIHRIREILNQEGYRRIDVQATGNGYDGTACRDGNRYNISMNKFGQLRRADPAGPCQRRAMNPKQITAQLRQKGYDRIRFTDRQLPRYVAEACRGSEKLELVINRRGRIRQENRIGRCPTTINPRNIPKILANNGYTRVRVTDDQLPRYVAMACQGNDRFEIQMNRYGVITDRLSAGSCRRKALTPKQVRVKLRDDGYDRIRFTDRELPRYVAEACRGTERLELTIGRRGQIRDERRIGRCAAPINPRNIPKLLAKSGFDRIKVTDNRLPRYVAEACKGNRKVEITLNRYGEIRDQQPIGRCAVAINPRNLARILEKAGYTRVEIIDDTPPRYLVEVCKKNDRLELTLDKYGSIIEQLKVDTCRRPLSAKQLLSKLRAQGYTRVRYRGEDAGEFLIRACYKKRRLRLRFSAYGEVVRKRDVGPCVIPNLDAIAKRLGDRGYDRFKYFVEACRRGRLYRIQINEFGSPVARNNIGKCK